MEIGNGGKIFKKRRLFLHFPSIMWTMCEDHQFDNSTGIKGVLEGPLYIQDVVPDQINLAGITSNPM